MWRIFLKWVFSRYFIEDRVPTSPVDVVVVPSLCLRVGEDKLVNMNRLCTQRACKAVEQRQVAGIIFLCAYEALWRLEGRLRMDIVRSYNLQEDQLVIRGPVTDSYGEARLAAKHIRNMGWRTVLLVTDECHMMRALPALQSELPGATIFHEAVPCWQYERTRELAVNSTPRAKLISTIKSWRTATFTRWLLWNILMLHAPASMKKMPE